ncbi:MAG: ABC transporter permease, partial [Christensenellales bacterium]
IQTTRFWSSLLGSMGRILGGFLLAAALGTLLAALAARFKRVEELLAPLVLAMKTVPVASFIILALIWFGSRNLSVFIALVMVFPVMYTNVLSGIRAGRSLLEMARVFKIPALRRIRCIDLPQVMPYFRAGCTRG